MKEKLLMLLTDHPLTEGCTPEFLENLADDILTVIIRAAVVEKTYQIPCAETLNERVDDVYNDHFGVKLSNLFTTEYYSGKNALSFEDRQRVVKAMIETMVMEECAIVTFNDFNPYDDGRAELLKRRLTELRQAENANMAWQCLKTLNRTTIN
jgi:hypothetical protein